MMAVFTIYKPQARQCPVEFVSGDLWDPQKMTLDVKNAGRKPISQMFITSEMLLAPQDLRRPANFQWSSKNGIAPGAEQTLEKPGIPSGSAAKILGWVFFPSIIKYADGTEWVPENDGECFKAIWRDSQHPELPALPPLQLEINAD